MVANLNAQLDTLITGGSRISRRGGVDPLGGRGPPTWVLFGKNVCENEKIGSHRGACAQHAPLIRLCLYITLLPLLKENDQIVGLISTQVRHVCIANVVIYRVFVSEKIYTSCRHFPTSNLTVVTAFR